MFSIFKNLFQLSINRLTFFKRANSPNINFGKGNTFISQGIEVKPRSKGPYLLVQNQRIVRQTPEWIYSECEIVNLGSEPANDVKTYTAIYINGEEKFKSPDSASSIIPPDYRLRIRTEDPVSLVEKCTNQNSGNKYMLAVEYDDNIGNEYITVKAMFYNTDIRTFSTREEKAFRIPKGASPN